MLLTISLDHDEAMKALRKYALEKAAAEFKMEFPTVAYAGPAKDAVKLYNADDHDELDYTLLVEVQAVVLLPPVPPVPSGPQI